MRILALLLCTVCCAILAKSQGLDEAKTAAFGVPIQGDQGILKYPGLTVGLEEVHLSQRTDGKTPWKSWHFRVSDGDRRYVGVTVVFNSEKRLNQRSVGVHGKLYVLEYFFTSAGLSLNKEAQATSGIPLRDGEIVVWDEATAKEKNPIAHRIWESTSIDPTSLFVPESAYKDGLLIPDFDPNSDRHRADDLCLSDDSRGLKPVALVGDEKHLPSTIPVRPVVFGQRVDIRGGVLSFPQFQLVFTGESRLTPPLAKPLEQTSYGLAVFYPSGKRPDRVRDPGFETFGHANGSAIVLDGTKCVVEMFATTAIEPGARSDASHRTIPLRPYEIIVWDKAAAAARNPALLRAWDPPTPHVPDNWQYAGGAYTGYMFTGDIGWGPAEYPASKDLSASAVPTYRAPIRYPSELAGSGYVGHTSGIMFVDENGNAHPTTNYGNDVRFREPCDEALSRWHFTKPMKGNRPTKTVLSYTCVISEQEPPEAQVQIHG